MRKEFTYAFEVGDFVYLNVQGGKPVTIIDVSYSLLKGLEYLTLDSYGTREYYRDNELSREKIIEL